MEKWEHECAIQDAWATIGAIERDREDLYSLEREIAYGKEDFIRQIGYRRERAGRIATRVDNGIARRASAYVLEQHGWVFETDVSQCLESARQCVLARIGELDERIANEQTTILINELVLANWED